MTCLATAARAQYRFDVWTADDGLPQNIIRGIRQTPDGYLWIATLDGVARFDGVHFTIYNRSNTPGITSNRFNSMFSTHDGDLWLDTERGGVTRYHKGAFETLGPAEGIPGNKVEGLTGDDAGRVWILSGGRVEEWSEPQHRFNDITPPGENARYVPLLWQTGFWRVDKSGLHCFFRGAFLTYKLPAWLNSESVWVIARDGHGAMWMETHDGRRAVIRSGSLTVETIDRNSAPTTSFSDRSGNVWQMRIGKRLQRSLEYLSSGHMESITFRRLYEDREDNLWLCTEGKGLYRLQRQSIESLSTDRGLPAPTVFPVLGDHDGTVWIGTWGGGLSRYHSGHVTTLRAPGPSQTVPITALAEDHQGRIWFASNSSLNVIDKGHVMASPSPVLSKDVIVQAIFEDNKNTMWFGTSQGLLAYAQGRLRTFSVRDGLAVDDVRVIIGDPDGGLWFGGYGGLTRLRNGKFTHWREEDGLPSNNVRSIYRDSDGVLWIGTYDGGLGRLEGGKFTRFTTSNGLFNDGVFQILEDTIGNFWMTCNRGIYRVSKRELNQVARGIRATITSVAYGKADGMLNVECNGGFWPAGSKSPDGRLWFPTQQGVAIIDPRSISSNRQAPPVVIESATVDLTPIAVTSVVTLPPGRQNLEIHYTALSFINSGAIRFKYTLEGLDTQWSDVGARRTAYYSHIPSGNYVFHVIAENRDGVWNEEGQRLNIRVLAPFYKSWWFISLLLVLAVLSLSAAWRGRSAQFERQQRVQRVFSQQLISSQEHERKRIAAELHDSIGQRLAVINNLALFFLRDSTEALVGVNQTNSIREISAEAMSAIEETRGIAYNLRPFQLDRLGLSKAIEGLIRTVANASNLNFNTELDNIDDLFAPDLQINVYRIIQESLSNVMKYAQATTVLVQISRRPDSVTLIIEDDGRGISQDIQRTDDRISGFGMTGMAERAGLLGGKLLVRSSPQNGTRVTVSIPLTNGSSVPDSALK